MTNNQIEHFLKWKPFIIKHGLILLELHTISPNIVKNIQTETPCIAYDATHGFSDQYLIEYDVFKKILNKINLTIDKKHERVYPKKHPTISINYIK